MRVDEKVFKHALEGAEQRALAHFEAKDWKERVAKDSNISKQQLTKLFTSRHPSLKVYCMLINYLDNRTSGL